MREFDWPTNVDAGTAVLLDVAPMYMCKKKKVVRRVTRNCSNRCRMDEDTLAHHPIFWYSCGIFIVFFRFPTNVSSVFPDIGKIEFGRSKGYNLDSWILVRKLNQNEINMK